MYSNDIFILGAYGQNENQNKPRRIRSETMAKLFLAKRYQTKMVINSICTTLKMGYFSTYTHKRLYNGQITCTSCPAGHVRIIYLGIDF